MRSPSGFIRPGFDPLKNPDAPTGVSASGGDQSADVSFTPPSNVGGSAVSAYYVVSNPGGITASSPVSVTGLTNGTAYTFTVWALNTYGPGPFSAASNSVTPLAQGQQAYTTAGTYSWVAPAEVTTVSVVSVGAGAGGGGGGALAYKNNITVVPGSSYTVVVGASGISAGGGASGSDGGNSTFTAGFGTMTAGGGRSAAAAAGGVPSGTYDAGYSGGRGASGNPGYSGGGAGGYTGDGGSAVWGGSSVPSTGGGGSSGGWPYVGGGGVGLLGLGSSATGGTTPNGGVHGGGSGGNPAGGVGGVGGVRIIWPGDTRQFPSTNTGDL